MRVCSSTFCLNATSCRPFASERHALQQAGPVERKKKKTGGWRRGGSVSGTCCSGHNSTRHIAFHTERAWIPVWLPEAYTQHYEKDLSWHKSQSLHGWCEGGRDELFNQQALMSSCFIRRWSKQPPTSTHPQPERKSQRSPGCFREQQWNNSSLSKWQPSSRRTITDCWSITPHMEDETTALPCWWCSSSVFCAA